MALERLDPDDRASWASWSADHLARYAFAAGYVSGRRVLDVGTGPGYGAAMLKGAGAREVVAIDLDPGTVAAAAKRYAGHGATYAVGDAEALEGLGAFDVVCSFENIEHLPHPDRFVAAAARVLAPGGVLLCSTPDRRATEPFVNGRPANPYHLFEWYADEFRALLEVGFEEVDLRAQVRAFGLALRAEAARAARQVLVLHNTVLRRSLGARVRRLLGGGPWLDQAAAAADRVGQLGAAVPADYPIVPGPVAALYGDPFCHVAVCARPRGA